MAAKKWMQREAAREQRAGTKGAFSAKARAAGESTAQYAREKEHAPGRLGRQARMALRFMAANH